MERSSLLTEPALDLLDIQMDAGLGVIDYPWVSYEEWNKEQARNIPEGTPSTSSSNDTATSLTYEYEIKDLKAERLQRRREQNRTSQQKFREKTRKAYETVLQALETERQTSARLRDEVTALHLAINCLTKGSQKCLETISRLCQSGYKNGQTVLEDIAALDDA